jgi:hypothetical protein
MNNLPNCIPQETYNPDFIPEDATGYKPSKITCPKCGSINTYEMHTPWGFDDYSASFLCDDCDYIVEN